MSVKNQDKSRRKRASLRYMIVCASRRRNAAQRANSSATAGADEKRKRALTGVLLVSSLDVRIDTDGLVAVEVGFDLAATVAAAS